MEKEDFYFITNQDITNQDITNQKERKRKRLCDIIHNISQNADNIYILVGFFYFSGFIKLKDEFKDKKMKILVGLDIDNKPGNYISEYEEYRLNLKTTDKSNLTTTNISRQDIRNKFYDSLIKAFSYSDIFEEEEIEESFKIFVKKIEDGSLEVRKTKQPNHAKLYIFENKPDHNENGEYPGIVITGSSNLSISGIEGRFEIDVVTRNKSHYDEAYEIYQKLWEDSVPVATKETFNEFKEKALNKIWINNLPSPYLIYIRVLKEYFSIKTSNIRFPKDIYEYAMNLKYQTDAVSQAIDIINKHNGVILADVVGLGKSIIASTIAHNLNLDTIIICPPHLIDVWKNYKRQFKIIADVYSTGKIEEAIEDYQNDQRQKLIVVDEAHRFRNSETISYANLWRLCQGNKVVLLTATPFNNTPEDIASLLKLFQIPTKSTLKHIDNLSKELNNLITEYKKLKKESKEKNAKTEKIKQKTDEISRRIRHIISPITIRRTRKDIEKIEKYKKDLEEQKIIFPIVKPPELVEFSFGNLDGLYLKTVEKFTDNNQKSFKAARYRILAYIKDKNYKAEKAVEYTGKSRDEALEFIELSQSNLGELIKRIFIKRFESSFGSFKKTLEGYITSHNKIKDYYYKKGKVPIYKKFNEIPDISEVDFLEPDELEEIEKELSMLEEKGLIWVEADKLSQEFIKDLESDIEILNEIKKNWESYLNEPQKYDYKLKELVKILKEKINKGEKVVIFSEFEDTVNYLAENLSGFRVVSYSSQKADDDLREKIKRNFDASVFENKQENDYDILITTDILSEGINLHRANNIINYDIPYNPTRVIQRVGRLNRISRRQFKEISIYNFFPTKIGEEHTNIKAISTLKMFMIHSLLGEDAKYLTNDEEVKSYFQEEFKKYEYMEEESWDAEYKNFLYRIEETRPDIIKQAESIPFRTKIRREKNLPQPVYIVFAKKGENLIFKKTVIKDGKEEIENISDEEAIKIFKADESEKSFEVSQNFYKKYNKIKQTLFTSQPITEKDRWEREVINKVLVFENFINLNNLIQYKNYISKLKKIIEEYDLIPKYFETIIKQMKVNSLKDIEEFTQKLPEEELDRIINKGEQLESMKDIIIISEEIN